MNLLTDRTPLTLAVAFSLPCMIGLWLVAVPEAVSPTTYAVAVALVVGLIGTIARTYRSGQAAGSLGQLLCETEAAPVTAAAHAGARRPDSL